MTLAELLEARFRGDIRFRGAAYLKAERVQITRVTAEDIAVNVAAASLVHPRLTESELERIRAMRSELFDRWFSLEPGATLELEFG